jgi:flavin-dependent dehydrogenase
MWDVIVAGAGPAGSAAAYMLARAGCLTLLADRLAHQGSKIGETLPGAGVRLLRSLGLPAPEIGGPHRSVSAILSSWNSHDLLARYSIRDPYGTAWRLDRDTFDADLRLAATVAGATFEAKSVSELQTRNGRWEVRFSDGTIEHAKWIVDATGRRAALARRLGVNRFRDQRLIAFYGLGRIDPDWQVDRTIMEAVSDGWWYAARLPSGAPIAGFHTHARKAADLRTKPDAWTKELIQTQHVSKFVSPKLFDKPPRALDARGARLADFDGDGWIACGDAAMCFDPISGQGIFSALQSGHAAAKAVIDALDGDTAKLSEYSSRMEDAWAIYRSRAQIVYRSERRWQNAGFWSCER